jgi:hypothetical protein
MNDIITNGTEIKQRIISEINSSKHSIYLAMAWFTDRDIANAIIEAKNRGINVGVILSSNVQNENVKQLFRNANIDVHAFDTGDERGMMHHKFCLIDRKISINGSYNYSYNASNNNVENIHVSDNYEVHNQLFLEFERLKYNIDHNIDVNSQNFINTNMQQTINPIDNFSHQLNNLVYSSVQINTEEYKQKGYEKSRESEGSIDVFKAEYNNLKEQIRVYASDESLSSKKNNLISNIDTAYENKKEEIESDKQGELKNILGEYELEKQQLSEKNSAKKQEKQILETGNQSTGEKGILQINKEIEKNNLEIKNLNQSIIVKKFFRFDTILASTFLVLCVFYLSIFFASALYKIFFEGNLIEAALQASQLPPKTQLIDANAIIKIFVQEGALFGFISAFVFLFPLALTNLYIIGSANKTVNLICFWIGLVIFDILVSGMVAINFDKIDSLRQGKTSTMQFWEVVKQGEFYLIFVFGMLPLFITHNLINLIRKAYQNSKKEIVDAVKVNQINILEAELIDLNSDKELLLYKLKQNEEILNENLEKLKVLEKELNAKQNQLDNKYSNLHKQFKLIFDDFHSKIVSGKIFTDEILNSVVSSFTAGYIQFLPEYYAESKVASRVREIEQIIANKI